MKNKLQSRVSNRRGYTLVETLVASAVMMVAVGAAASLSLAMVTQEEMAERTVRAANYLENTAMLYQMGFEPAEISDLLPVEPVVTALTTTSKTVAVTNLGNVDVVEMEVTFRPSSASSDNPAGTPMWTGGNQSLTRSHAIEVMRSNP